MAIVLHLRGCRLLCAALCWVLWSSVASAQTSRSPGQPGTLAGILIDGETGEALVGATFVGPGVSNHPESDRWQMLIFRDKTGGFYLSTIFTDLRTNEDGCAIKLEVVDSSSARAKDSRTRLEAGNMDLSHNAF